MKSENYGNHLVLGIVMKFADSLGLAEHSLGLLKNERHNCENVIGCSFQTRTGC